jgi:hypothetical protein
MSDTPESTPAILPAEGHAAQQSELCFGEVGTQNEMQIEMRFETDETRAETKNEPLAQTPNQTQAEARNAIRFETVGTQVEPQIETQADPVVEPRAETHVKTRAEAPNQTQAETRNELRFETVGIPVATQAVTPTEAQTETRVEAQTETRVEIGQVEIQNEKQAEKPATPRPEPQAVTLNDRPFRVKLRGSVLVLIRLPNKRQLRAALHQLSTTGGVINLEKPLDEKIVVELIFHIDHSTIRGKAQMLFPMWATQGWMQPFRFVELTDTDRNALQENLQSFIGNMAKGASAAS